MKPESPAGLCQIPFVEFACNPPSPISLVIYKYQKVCDEANFAERRRSLPVSGETGTSVGAQRSLATQKELQARLLSLSLWPLWRRAGERLPAPGRRSEPELIAARCAHPPRRRQRWVLAVPGPPEPMATLIGPRPQGTPTSLGCGHRPLYVFACLPRRPRRTKARPRLGPCAKGFLPALNRAAAEDGGGGRCGCLLGADADGPAGTAMERTPSCLPVCSTLRLTLDRAL